MRNDDSSPSHTKAHISMKVEDETARGPPLRNGSPRDVETEKRTNHVYSGMMSNK